MLHHLLFLNPCPASTGKSRISRCVKRFCGILRLGTGTPLSGKIGYKSRFAASLSPFLEVATSTFQITDKSFIINILSPIITENGLYPVIKLRKMLSIHDSNCKTCKQYFRLKRFEDTVSYFAPYPMLRAFSDLMKG